MGKLDVVIAGTQTDSIAEEEKPIMEFQRAALSDALYQKCLLLKSTGSEVTSEDFEAVSLSLRKLLDAKSGDSRYAEISAVRFEKTKQYGRAFKFALQAIEEKATAEKYRELSDLARRLDWIHVAEYFTEKIPVLFPGKYELFWSLHFLFIPTLTDFTDFPPKIIQAFRHANIHWRCNFCFFYYMLFLRPRPDVPESFYADGRRNS